MMLQKIKERLLAFLRIRTIAAGLDVSDEVLRVAILDGMTWKMYATRLAPGVLEKGKIKDRAAFVTAVVALKKEMGPKLAKRLVGAVVCMSSVDIYTQVFRLPMVQEGNLDEAVALNLQMASPIPADEAYSGWQVVGRNEHTVQIEILAAFIHRTIVDEMAAALFEGGFIAMAVESRGLALTRLVREKVAGIEVPKAYLFIDIDNFGLDFLIIRNGAFYFEYQNPWRDLMDNKGEITVDKFREMLMGSLRQVLNFYSQSWPEPLGAIILSTVVFREEAEKVIAEGAAFPAMRLTLVMGQPISSEWLVVLGSSLRAAAAAGGDREIDLLGGGARDRFYEERMLRFMQFWRVVVPVTLGLLVAVFIGADLFLANIITAGAGSTSTMSPAQFARITTLESTAQTFNGEVALLGSVEHMVQPKYSVLQKLSAFAAATGVTLTNVTMQSFDSPVSLTGFASARDHIQAFQADLANDKEFSQINLPLTGVQTQVGSVTFTMTFVVTPPAVTQ